MTEVKRSTVVGVFPSLEQANTAVKELLQAGFTEDNIGFIVRESEELKEQREAEATGQAAVVRSAGGAVSGGVLAGAIGALVAFALPGFGPVLSAGLLAAAGGAIAGGFTGLMSTLDLSDEEIRWYQGELEAGRPIVAVRTDGRYSEALAIMQIHGSYDMKREREYQESHPETK